MPYKGTDRDAYRRAGQASNNPKKQAKLYQKFKTENAKKNKDMPPARSSFNSPRQSPHLDHKAPRNYGYQRTTKPATPRSSIPVPAAVKPKPVQPTTVVANKPKSQNTFITNSFTAKQPFIATAKKKSEFATTVVAKLQNYLVSKLTDAAEELVKIGVKKALSSFFPTDLVEKIEKVYDFADTINTYIKVGQKVYQVITKITKHGKNVKVDTYHIEVEYRKNNDYRNFYRNNISKIRELPSQINIEIDETPIEEWSFGGNEEECNELFDLVVRGKKTATCCLAECGEPPAKKDSISILTNYDKSKKLKIKTTKQYFCKFKDITAEHAYKEGEGDLSLDYWRKVHKDFFIEELQELNKSFDEEILLSCEEFIVIK